MYIEATTLLQGVSGSTATVFIRWPYILHTFDRVLRRVACEALFVAVLLFRIELTGRVRAVVIGREDRVGTAYISD
jgi:hypothetical protein